MEACFGKMCFHGVAEKRRARPVRTGARVLYVHVRVPCKRTGARALYVQVLHAVKYVQVLDAHLYVQDARTLFAGTDTGLLILLILDY